MLPGNSIEKLFSVTWPPRLLVAKLKAAYRYPVKYCHVLFSRYAGPSWVNDAPSVL